MGKTLKETIETVLKAKSEMEAMKLAIELAGSDRKQTTLMRMWHLKDHKSGHWGPIERAIERGLYELAMDLVNIHGSQSFYAVVKRHGLDLKEPSSPRSEEEALMP
jgi:hypothetical protein